MNGLSSLPDDPIIWLPQNGSI